MATLKALINEEFDKLLNELENQDIVDINKIDIQAEYDKLNQLLYGGKLPKLPLIFNSKRHGYARVTGLYNRATREVTLKNLEVSNQYKFTYKQFRDILAHEMIHVYQMGVRKEKGGHGWDFHSEARRINGMGLGLNITERNGEDIPASDLAKSKFNKKLIAIIFNKDGEYVLTVTTPGVYEREKDQVFGIFERAVNRGQYRSVEITVVETSNPEIAGFPVARTFARKISQIKLPDRLLELLLNDNIIKEVKIKQGMPLQVSEEAVPGTQQQGGEWEQIEIV